MNEIDKTLDERGARYGRFDEQAALAQTLKACLRPYLELQDYALRGPVCEAVDHICTKLARIACGDPLYADNWRDIAGYATLVLRDLEGEYND